MQISEIGGFEKWLTLASRIGNRESGIGNGETKNSIYKSLQLEASSSKLEKQTR
jgi:hypothetical protein